MCASIAPWALACGLVVSFTASAGYAPVAHTLRGAQYPLTPREIAARNAAPLFDGRVRVASLSADWALASRTSAIERTRRAATLDGDVEPSLALKSDAHEFPAVDRRLKGDPIPTLRPSISRVAPRPTPRELAQILFSVDEDNLVLSVFRPSREEIAPDGFERADARSRGITLRDLRSSTPPEAASETPAQDANAGATPSIERDLALASATPAATGATPLMIAAAPVSIAAPNGGVTSIARNEARPHYADLVTPAALGREMKCLAEAVYFEARSESEAGQAAVAQVVLNRLRSGLYPGSVCGVVYQNSHRYLGCQFTFACEGKSLRVTDAEAWSDARRVAKAVFEGAQYNDEVGAATHYHARYVRPSWAKRLKRMDAIGQHVFYRLRPGQT